MRVKIKNYTSWFGPYQLAEKLMFWVPKEKDEYGFSRTADRVHDFGEWLAHGSVEPESEVGEITSWGDRPSTLLARFLSWIHNKKKRTIEVHLDPFDTWNMQDTLGYIVRPMLKQLKETKHGSPFVDDEDVSHMPKKGTASGESMQYDLFDGEEQDKLFWDQYEKRWDWVMDEMIFAFESLEGGENEDWESSFWSGESDLQWKKLEDGMSEMVHGPNHTAVHDKEGYNAYAERVQNGFRLFGKYYQNLWD